MSTPRRLYSKAEIRILAGAPGALARPPNLLPLIDRSKYEKHISPDRGHSSVKSHHKNQKQRPNVSAQASLANQRWKPKHNEQRSGYTSRHWDHALAGDDHKDEPEWADEVVDYSENFDFSQATLERDKEKPVQPIAAQDSIFDLQSSTPTMSRFGFALEDTMDAEALIHMRQPTSTISEQVPLSTSQSQDFSQVRHSRFKFSDASELNADNHPESVPPHSSYMSQDDIHHRSTGSLQSEPSRTGFTHHQDRTTSHPAQLRIDEASLISAHPAHMQSQAVNVATRSHPSSTVPKGKPIEVSQMFQMYAMANNLPPAPAMQPMVSAQNHRASNDMSILASPSQIPVMSGPLAHFSNAMPSALYNPSLTGPPPPGLRPGIPSPKPPTNPVRPLSIVGLGQTHHPDSRIPQPSSTRSSSNDKRRSKADSNAALRPKAPVPAATAPPSYVRSYMNIQLPQQSSLAGYYVPPGMSGNPAQSFIGQHMTYPSPSPPAPYR